MAEYTKNHLVTVAYLRNWCGSDGLLRVSRPSAHATTNAVPEAVGYQKAWWSRSRELNARAEKACSRLEALASRLLNARARWPYEGQERATLAEFIALHVLRTRAWRRWYEGVRESALGKQPGDGQRGADVFSEILRVARSDEETLGSFERMLGSVAGLLASMHWTLIEFGEPVLATSDQPVAPVRLPKNASVAPFAAMPRAGLLETLEIRFPLAPARALLLSWAPEADDRVLRGSWLDAINLNQPTIDRAEFEYFLFPDCIAALPSDAMRWCRPLSTQLFSGYSESAARDSPHRRQVGASLEALVDRDPKDRGIIPVVRPGTPRQHNIAA